MRKGNEKLLFGLLTLGTISAQASMLEINGPLDSILYEAQVNEEKTYFETLGDLFKVGTLPNLARISNIAWSGRCFKKNKQNDPINAGYVFRPKKNYVGPIDTSSEVYEAFTYWAPIFAPDFFDNKDIK